MIRRWIFAPLVLSGWLLAAAPARAELGPTVTGLGQSGVGPPASAGSRPSFAGKLEILAVHGWVGFVAAGGDATRGYPQGGAELVLFNLTWRSGYWELLRVGGGWPMLGWVGTAVGLRHHLDARRRHELRVGVHVTFLLAPLIIPLPFESGLQVRYVWRRSDWLALHVGLMQLSYPYSGVVLTLGIGL